MTSSGKSSTSWVAISTFGVPLAIRTSGPALMTSVRRILPPDNVPIDLGVTLTEFALDHDKTGMFHVSQDDRPLARAAELATAIGSLDAHIRLFIASNAPGHVFIHAGAVTHRGLGLLLPGPSLAGKTELVACLVKIGATYYSDEYAVLDPNGLLHPYPKPLSIRTRDRRESTDVDVGRLGGRRGTRPVPVAIIATTHYDATAAWRPEPRSKAAGVMILLAHSGLARRDPARALRSFTGRWSMPRSSTGRAGRQSPLPGRCWLGSRLGRGPDRPLRRDPLGSVYSR